MAYVLTEPCIRCKYADCAAVCPVSCFHEGPNFLVIDPDGCIDCDICDPECTAYARMIGRCRRDDAYTRSCRVRQRLVPACRPGIGL